MELALGSTFFQRHSGDLQIEFSLNNKGNVLLCINLHHNRELSIWIGHRFKSSLKISMQLCCFGLRMMIYSLTKKERFKVTTQHSRVGFGFLLSKCGSKASFHINNDKKKKNQKSLSHSHQKCHK